MVTLDQIAHEQTVRATAAAMAAQLDNLFGRRVTTAILGVVDSTAVGLYAAGRAAPPPAVDAVLRATFHAVKLLEQVESAETIRAWFEGMNPLLDDQAPASLIRTEPERVLRVARRFAMEG